jgi:hypothetical protein
MVILISCEGDFYIDYEWTGMTAVHGNNDSKWPEPTDADSIAANNYVLILQMETNELKREGKYLDDETPPKNVNWLDSIIITSNLNLDSNHLKGSNLSDLFVILNESYTHTLSADTGNFSRLTNTNSPDFYNNPNVTQLDLIFQKKIIQNELYKFYVSTILRDGTTFRDSTTIIRLY